MLLEVLDNFLSYFRWYRRLGGKWELWFVAWPVNCYVWHRVTDWSAAARSRPSPLCRGRPRCEEYGTANIWAEEVAP